MNDEEGLSFELVRGELPVPVAAAVESAADNPYRSLAEARAFTPELLPRLHHLVARAGTSPRFAISFHERAGALIVVNQCVPVTGRALDAWSGVVFREFPDASRVELVNAVWDARHAAARPVRLIDRGTENFVLALPATVEEYRAQFQARARQKFRNLGRRLEKEHAGAAFSLIESPEIDDALVGAIVELNHRRMRAKGGTSSLDAGAVRALTALARDGGAVGAFRMGPRVIGGAICARTGPGWTLMVLAHDPEFDAYSLGMLCLLQTVEAAIAQRATTFHMLWGRYDYKIRAGAHPVPLRDVRVYRSRLAWLADWPVMLPVHRASFRRAWWTARKRLALGRFLPWRPRAEPSAAGEQ